MTSNLVTGFAGQPTLMSRLGLVFTAPALEWCVDSRVWPAIGERRDGQLVGGLILAIGTLWLAVPLRALLGIAPHPIADLGLSGTYGSLGVGIALMLWGLRILMRRQTIRIDDDRVHVTLRRVTGATSWSEPLGNYRGVVWRSEAIYRRDSWQTLHLIDLWHEDPSRTVTLLSSMSAVAARDFWQGWAEGLGLAAIRRQAGDEQVPAHEAATPLPSPR
jgi:hypothetical protein